MWKTARYMGCPLGCPSFPRYLAQCLALVPRTHKADAGRKVSKSGPDGPETGLVLNTFLHSNGHVPNDAESHPRNRPGPTTPGRPHGISAQRNTSGSAEGQPANTPTPYPRIYARSVCQCCDVYSSERTYRTLHLSCGSTLGYRSWALRSLLFGSC